MSNPYEAPKSPTNEGRKKSRAVWLVLAGLFIVLALLAALGLAAFSLTGSSESIEVRMIDVGNDAEPEDAVPVEVSVVEKAAP